MTTAVYTRTHQLTYVVGAAELQGDDVLHVAMETEEDLNGVNLHLQSAGQVHHLTHTDRHTHRVKLSTCIWHVSGVYVPCGDVTLRSSGG